MQGLCAGQVFEAPKAHRSKHLDEVVRPAQRGVGPRRLRYDRRRDTDRGPEKHAGHSPPSWLSTPLFSDLIVVPDARAGEARCELSSHDTAQRCPGMPGCCRLALRSHLQGRRKSSQSWHAGTQKTPRAFAQRSDAFATPWTHMEPHGCTAHGRSTQWAPSTMGSERPLAGGGCHRDEGKEPSFEKKSAPTILQAVGLGVQLYISRKSYKTYGGIRKLE